MRVGHVDEDVLGDAGVVGDQVGQLRRAHVDVEHHLLVSVERLAEIVRLDWLQSCLASAIEVLFHLGVVELMRIHIEVPKWLRQHSWDQKHGIF